MGKETDAGIDVSKDILDVAVRPGRMRPETALFANDATAHRAVVPWLTKRGGSRAASYSGRGRQT
jgi:hypothetical protein